MGRVTQKDERGYYLVGDGIYSDWGTPEKFQGNDVDRLAAYEDTGLEPEEIIRNGMMFEDNKRYAGRLELKLKAYEKLGPIDRLRALAQADREGRCVVLPCKMDDVLWTFHTYPSKRVYSFHVTDLSTLNGRTMLNTDIMGVVDSRDVGKTVFLTRKEAEAALRGALE